MEIYLPNESWAAWSLSREGRYILRLQNVESGIVQGNACDYTDEKFSMNDAAANMERDIFDTFEMIEQVNETALTLEEEEDSIEEQNCFELNDQIESTDSEQAILTSPDDQTIDNFTKDAINLEIKLNAKFKTVLNDWREKSLHDVIEIDFTHNLYDKALEVIEDYYHKINKDCDDNLINEIFDEWLFKSNSHFPQEDLNRENDFLVWQNLYKHDDIRTISLIALILISIGTSESDVERLISLHRYIVHDRMTNISPDVLLARLRMRAKAISDNYLSQTE